MELCGGSVAERRVTVGASPALTTKLELILAVDPSSTPRPCLQIAEWSTSRQLRLFKSFLRLFEIFLSFSF